MFLVSRLLLYPHVIATHSCVLGQQLVDARGRKGLLLLELKHATILTRLCPPRTDPVVSFPVASTTSSQCLGRKNPFPAYRPGSVLCQLDEICCLQTLGAPACLSLAQPGFGVHCQVPAFCIQSMESVSLAVPAPRDKAGHDLCVLSLKR